MLDETTENSAENNAANNIDQFVDELLELSGLELSADIKTEQENITIDLTGDDVSLLLGHNGELLNAFEYLTNKIYAKRLPDARIVFDSAGFRSRRERELQLMAKHAAERVRVSKRHFTFEPMSPGERRIVHVALTEETGVRTESQGEGEDRKVTVYPV
jgi:spoIIIJ-associated protein